MASRLTIKRFDPWSVLKFGAVANLALLAILMLVAGVVWFIIDRLALVDQACEMAGNVGFTTCGVNAGNLFRALALLGLLGVVVQTAVLVFFAFLHNLIADLTGGIVIGVVEEPGARREPRRVTTASTPPARGAQPGRPATAAGQVPTGQRTGSGATASSGSAPNGPGAPGSRGPGPGPGGPNAGSPTPSSPGATSSRTSSQPRGGDSIFGGGQA